MKKDQIVPVRTADESVAITAEMWQEGGDVCINYLITLV